MNRCGRAHCAINLWDGFLCRDCREFDQQRYEPSVFPRIRRPIKVAPHLRRAWMMLEPDGTAWLTAEDSAEWRRSHLDDRLNQIMVYPPYAAFDKRNTREPTQNKPKSVVPADIAKPKVAFDFFLKTLSEDQRDWARLMYEALPAGESVSRNGGTRERILPVPGKPGTTLRIVFQGPIRAIGAGASQPVDARAGQGSLSTQTTPNYEAQGARPKT